MKRKKNPFEITISSFVLACLKVKKSQFGKSLELSKFPTISSWAVSAKPGGSTREPRSLPKALSPLLSPAAVLLQAAAEGIRTTARPALFGMETRLLAPVGQPSSFPCSLPPLLPPGY